MLLRKALGLLFMALGLSLESNGNGETQHELFWYLPKASLKERMVFVGVNVAHSELSKWVMRAGLVQRGCYGVRHAVFRCIRGSAAVSSQPKPLKPANLSNSNPA